MAARTSACRTIITKWSLAQPAYAVPIGATLLPRRRAPKEDHMATHLPFQPVPLVQSPLGTRVTDQPTPEQTAFGFSWIAYRGDPLPLPATVDATILAGTLPKRIEEKPILRGRWELAWGPAIAKQSLAVVDGSMAYAVRSRPKAGKPQQVVVAIRGTNPLSLTTWIFENFMVASTAPWPYGGGDGLLLSTGMAAALDTLLRTTPPAVDGRLAVSLVDFLRETVAASAEPLEIVVTGHSLGGCLACLLATALADTRSRAAGLVDRPWDPEAKAKLITYTFAAPSAGNAAFADHVDAVIGSTLRQIRCSMDIVPHAWDPERIAKVPDLYEDRIAPPLGVSALCKWVENIAAKNGYRHPKRGDDERPGEISDKPLPIPLGEITARSYLAQAVFQHGEAYIRLLNLTDQFWATEVFQPTLPADFPG
jgi:pimeloyl-ACP methyl ester carboxylesterase